MEEQCAIFCDTLIAGLQDRSKVDALAKEAAGNFSALPDLIMDTAEDALKSGIVGAGAKGQDPVLSSWDHNVNVWYFLDKVCKLGGASFIAAMKARLSNGLAQQGCPQKTQAPTQFGSFVEVIGSLRLQLPAEGWIFSLIDRELGLSAKPQGNQTGGRSTLALTVQSQQVRTLGAGFVKQKTIAKRENHQLQVRTKDSLRTLKTGSVYAPAAPAEISVAQMAPDADAPTGFMQALPAGYEENYQNKRRKRLRDMFATAQDEVDKEMEEATNKRRGVTGAGAAMKMWHQ